MRYRVFSLSLIILFAVSCTKRNPLLEEFGTPFGTSPFQEIKEKHYRPAFEAGIAQQQSEIEAIITNPEAPTFKNTIEALEASGELLRKVQGVFYNLNAAHTSDRMQQIAGKLLRCYQNIATIFC